MVVVFDSTIVSLPPPPGKLVTYDADGDGDFDMEDAKVLLGKSALVFCGGCSSVVQLVLLSDAG